jgi:REP-associated tyrosine transposase
LLASLLGPRDVARTKPAFGQSGPDLGGSRDASPRGALCVTRRCQTHALISAQFKMARRVKERQRSFEFVGWGGEREGAGRPKKPGAKLRHVVRASLASRYPVHVTLRTVRGAPNLRRSASYEVIERALGAARERDDFRVVHFSVQTNHLHLLVEANGANELSRGMQGFAISIARGVNRAARRTGRLWVDRFHSRILKSPREVRVALCYVLQNTRRHATTDTEILDPCWIDPRSSGPWFDGWWRAPDGPAPPGEEPPTAEPQTWLLSDGWRRHDLIRVDEVPRAALA